MITRILTGKPHGNTLAETTDRALTLYVRTTGSDTTGDGSSGNPFREVQKALSLVPKRIRHNVTIDIGEGTFNGFALEGFFLSEAGSEAAFLIKGVLGTPTVDGKTSDTADSGTKLVLTDADGGWTAGQLIGILLKVGSNYRVIEDNDDTTITVASQFPSNIGASAYELVEPKTVINTIDTLTYLWPVSIQNCNVGYRRYLTIENLDIQAPNNTESAFTAYGTGAFVFRRSRISVVSGGSYGISIQTVFNEWGVEDVYMSGAWGQAGMSAIFAQGTCRGLRFLSNGLTGNGARFLYCNAIDAGDFSVIDCGGLGVDARDVQNMAITRIKAAGNGSHGLEIRNARVDLSLLEGTGNTGCGVNVRDRGQLEIAGTTPTITGSSGDATVNGGANTLTWASDFASNGDLAVNDDTGARIIRED